MALTATGGGASKLPRQDRDVETRLRAFAARHGDGVVAVINHVGRVGARIVVIAPSGEFGDALASSVDAATAICERLGLPVREWDRETTGLLAPSAADRVQMGTRRR
ncbi:MAG: hypothetical protein J0I11_14040 [Actinobacteria bacterium]|nr:hypothetical protein [Actinomycetota bacterium]